MKMKKEDSKPISYKTIIKNKNLEEFLVETDEKWILKINMLQQFTGGIMDSSILKMITYFMIFFVECSYLLTGSIQ